MESLMNIDAAALITAIDADTTPPSIDTLADTEDTSYYAPLNASGDEWWLFDDWIEAPTPSTAAAVVPEPTPSVSSNESEPKPTSTNRVKTCRERQKAELAYLKERVVVLEQQLQELKDSNSNNTRDSLCHDEEQNDQLTVSDSIKAFWKQRAEGERRARERAIAENAKLRHALETQLKVARSLARVLRKRPNEDPSFALTNDDMPSKRHRLHDARDDEIYSFLLENLDARYTQVDTVWSECGLSSCQSVYQDARYVESPHKDARTPWYLEFVESRVAPFDYSLVRDVTWRALLTPTIPLDNGVYEVIEAVDDLIKAEFRIQLHVGSVDVLGRARFVLRRYLEESRMIFVWAMWSTTEGLHYDQQIRLIEEGWGIVCPLQSDQDANVETSTSLMQTCGRMRPDMTIKKSSKLEAQVGLLTDMLLGTYHDILRGLDDHMGRMMVETAMG